jgi:hypothetical protein
MPGLVKLPQMLLQAFICVTHPIGGLTPEKISPTSIGYFVHVESLYLQTMLFTLDLFYFAESAMAFLALRHICRMKFTGALVCVVVPIAVEIGFRMLGAK